MELLILLALTCWGGARYMTHTPLRIAERRQRSTQTHQLRMARLAKRQGPTVSQAITTRIARRLENPRGGPAREAIALWWSDSWGYATTRRLARHERAEAGQLGRQRAARAAKRWIGAQWDDLTGNTPDQQPVQAAATVTHPHTEPDDIVDAEIVDDPTPTPPDGPDPAPPAAATAQPDPPPPSPAPTNDPAEEPDDHMASVHPLHPHRKEFTVSTPTHTTITSGEILDPAAARQFCVDIEQAVQQLFSATELSVASLTGCGVTGEPIDDLAAMQEALTLVIDRARSATSHFDRHLAAQDHIMSDPTLAATLTDTYLARG